MAIPIRSPAEIDAIARAAEACASILRLVASRCVVDAVTDELDALADAEIARIGAEAIFKGYRAGDGRAPFTGCMCVSINEELVHGVPGERLVRPGDVVSLDLGLKLGGWCADCAITVLIDPVSPANRALHHDVLRVLESAVGAMAPGALWSEVVHGCAHLAGDLGLRLIEPYAGHGVGRDLHEPPRAPLLNRDAGALAPEQDFVLRPGMVLTVEPIGIRGTGETIGADDGWTVLARDRAIGCHEERMVAIVRGGNRALTASLGHGRECR